jgi:predicted amidophosphoribosyltransferase
VAIRFSEIDDTNRGDHFHLLPDDACLYLYEYTSHQGYSFSATNQLISNLKKKPTSSQGQLYYKGQAVMQCATALRDALNPEWLAMATIVPVPCSKAVGHAEYDNRMESVARLIQPGVDVRNLVIQLESTLAAHEAPEGERVTVAALLELYEMDEGLTNPAPRTIGVLDDVLTAGTHFRAMSVVLSQRFPGVPITGLFIARRVFPPAAADFAGVDLDF